MRTCTALHKLAENSDQTGSDSGTCAYFTASAVILSGLCAHSILKWWYEDMFVYREYIFAPGECVCASVRTGRHMGLSVFTWVCSAMCGGQVLPHRLNPPLWLSLWKPSVGELKVQGPAHCAMDLYHPLCLNIYCPPSPGGTVPRKAVACLLGKDGSHCAMGGIVSVIQVTENSLGKHLEWVKKAKWGINESTRHSLESKMFVWTVAQTCMNLIGIHCWDVWV